MVDYLQGDYAQYPPNYFFAYSNSAVALLADVIATASGMSFLDYSQAFLRSLGMNRSSFDRDDPAVAVSQTKNYYNGQSYFDGHINSPATGAMLSSVSDMAKSIDTRVFKFSRKDTDKLYGYSAKTTLKLNPSDSSTLCYLKEINTASLPLTEYVSNIKVQKEPET